MRMVVLMVMPMMVLIMILMMAIRRAGWTFFFTMHQNPNFRSDNPTFLNGLRSHLDAWNSKGDVYKRQA